MSAGLTLYRLASGAAGPVLPMLLARRAAAGKEAPDRLHERRARGLPARPGGPLVWLHGASVGESLMLFELAQRLRALRPDLALLFTSQTQTSARLLAERLPENALHQMAPVDTPAIADRFIAHWRPDLAVFAEGEIWPNLLAAATRGGAKLALVNARMTDKSLAGWARWPQAARATLSRFDAILAADRRTAAGLSQLSGRDVSAPGNLKAALPAPEPDAEALAALKADWPANRKTLLAASTHQGEEALVLDALAALPAPRPILILVPRHPERGDDIASLLKARGVQFARRSCEPMRAEADALLADTMGEMGLWLALADAVYLGGAHAENVGGHNPLDAVRLGKPVATGPLGHNFADMFADLQNADALTIATDAASLNAWMAKCLDSAEPPTPRWDRLDAFFADAPMQATLDALTALLEPAP